MTCLATGMSNAMSPVERNYSEVATIENIEEVTRCVDALIVAAGFEERAFNVLPNGTFSQTAHCILIRFSNAIAGNEEIFQQYLAVASQKFSADRLHVIELLHRDPQKFATDLSQIIADMPRTVRHFAVDISGMPSYSICLALKTVRDHRSRERLLVLYTWCNPSLTEYEELVRRHPDDIELLPKSMALEMDENLVLQTFSGYRSQNAKACLVVFAGYEAHRSTGVIEAVNPALLLLLYGNPGDPSLSWRLELSKKLHRKFEKGRRTATEVVSTLHISESLDVLETYYNYLIDDYDLVISPIGSKMHVVAAFLFWEKYGETQLTFPIPIGYDPAHRPRGIAKTYAVTIEARRRLLGEALGSEVEADVAKSARIDSHN